MERNNDNLNSQGFGATGGSSSSGAGPESGYEAGSSSGAGSSGFGGGSGLGNSGSQGYGAGISGGSGHEGSASSTQSFGGTSGSGSFGGTSDSIADKAKSGLGTAKEKATELKATLADKLEAGAEKLRQSQSGGYAGATADGSVAADSGALGQVNAKLASGMQSTADFLRNADLDNMKQGIEKQVRENPGRSLLIAAGLGYLLGKAFRK